jgi:short-subunit dehydrogenase
MAIPLRNKVVLITGASSGFGEDAARLFAAEGCKVVLAARRINLLQSLVDTIQSEGGEAFAIPVDVANRKDIDNMVDSALHIYGQIDILFNNAGFGRLDWLENLDPERDIETQVQVNLLGVIQTTRAVLPYMIARGQGHIINMSSVAGLIAAPLYTIYAATKFGVRAFTDALRREVSPFGIQVSGIYPGPASTEFGLHTGRNPAKRSLRRFAWLQMTSEHVAAQVVELARYPRRSVVIPWWYRLIVAFEKLFPGVVDWILKYAFTKRFHIR